MCHSSYQYLKLRHQVHVMPISILALHFRFQTTMLVVRYDMTAPILCSSVSRQAKLIVCQKIRSFLHKTFSRKETASHLSTRRRTRPVGTVCRRLVQVQHAWFRCIQSTSSHTVCLCRLLLNDREKLRDIRVTWP